MEKSRRHNLYHNPKVYNLPFEPPRQKRPKKFPKLLVVIILVLALYYTLFNSNLFSIKSIIVDDGLPPTVNDHLNKYLGANIFKLRSNAIKVDVLGKFPELTDLRVTRGLPDSIKVSFNERIPKLVWQTGPKAYLVDASGIAYKEVADSGQLIVVKDNNNLSVSSNQQVVSGKFIDFVTNAKDSLEKTSLAANHFEVNETTFQVDAIAASGLKIKFDITRSVDSQMAGLTKFLEQNDGLATQYIDLRVEGKVYYI